MDPMKDENSIDTDSKLFKLLKELVIEKKYNIIRHYHSILLRNANIKNVWRNDDKLTDELYGKYSSKHKPLSTVMYNNLIHLFINLLNNSSIDNYSVVENSVKQANSIINDIKSKNLHVKYSKQFKLCQAMSMSFYVLDIEKVHYVSEYFRIALDITEDDQCEYLDEFI